MIALGSRALALLQTRIKPSSGPNRLRVHRRLVKMAESLKLFYENYFDSNNNGGLTQQEFNLFEKSESGTKDSPGLPEDSAYSSILSHESSCSSSNSCKSSILESSVHSEIAPI